jgi:cell division protein ZapA (FtsZ GTPase activity inhibitor)
MPKPVNETTVQLRGASYQLRTDLSPETIARIAALVDGKMKELDPRATLPPPKVSVLTSLSIAGDLIEERERWSSERHALARRLEHLQELLDEALGGD